MTEGNKNNDEEIEKKKILLVCSVYSACSWLGFRIYESEGSKLNLKETLSEIRITLFILQMILRQQRSS